MNLIPLPRMSEYLLDDFMTPMGLTVQDVAAGAGISLDELCAVLVDEQEVTPELSKKLGVFFGVSNMLFYDIQAELKERASVCELAYA